MSEKDVQSPFWLFSKIQTSVPPTPIAAMKMQSVITPLDLTTVPVDLDLMEMAKNASVSI